MGTLMEIEVKIEIESRAINLSQLIIAIYIDDVDMGNV